MQLTSVFVAHIYILDGVKNFRSEDVNTTVYQITNLYSMRNRTINMKQRKARVKFYKKKQNLFFTRDAYKGLRFFCVVQQFLGNWICNQLSKLVG